MPGPQPCRLRGREPEFSLLLQRYRTLLGMTPSDAAGQQAGPSRKNTQSICSNTLRALS